VLRGPSHRSWPQERVETMLGFGLLADGVSIERAQAEVDGIASGLDAAFPQNGTIGLRLTGWAEEVRADTRPRLMLVLGAAFALFLIVCLNLTSLLLGRGLERRREVTTRMAIGAGRLRVMRQIVAETAVLFGVGALLGLLIAIWATTLVVSIRSFNIPRMEEASVSPFVFAATILAALAAAAISGVVMAASLTRAPVGEGANVRVATPGRRSRHAQRVLIAVEVALALVLVSGAGVMLEGGRAIARTPVGFDATHLLQFRVTLPGEKYADSARQVTFHDRAAEALSAIPGVQAVGLVDVPPGIGGTAQPSVLLEGDPAPVTRRDFRRAAVRVVRHGYLEALGLRAVSGRFLQAADNGPGLGVVVNEAFAREFFDGTDAVGRRIRVVARGIPASASVAGDLGDLRTIVGVAPDVKEATVYRPVPATVYVPLSAGDARRMAVVVRTQRPAAELVFALRRAIADVDPDVIPAGFMSLGELIRSELSLNVMTERLLAVLAALSLTLAVIGVYGVTAHAVRQRTREIGIRIALGVAPAGVRRLVLAEGLGVLTVGLAAGGAAAIWGAAVLRSLVFGIDRTSPATFVAAAAVLALAVAAGGYLPARRASRIDPATVLRLE
jgi:predicted permease